MINMSIHDIHIFRTRTKEPSHRNLPLSLTDHTPINSFSSFLLNHINAPAVFLSVSSGLFVRVYFFFLSFFHFCCCRCCYLPFFGFANENIFQENRKKKRNNIVNEKNFLYVNKFNAIAYICYSFIWTWCRCVRFIEYARCWFVPAPAPFEPTAEKLNGAQKFARNHYSPRTFNIIIEFICVRCLTAISQFNTLPGDQTPPEHLTLTEHGEIVVEHTQQSPISMCNHNWFVIVINLCDLIL